MHLSSPTPRPRQLRSSAPLELLADPATAAHSAGLRYVTDAQPGIQRRRKGSGFRYLHPDGSPVRESTTLSRIQSLVIPPAWTRVWICPTANGHLQATGRDARNRKQSRYHLHWSEVRDETKYDRITLFASTLPTIRRHVQRDMALHGLPREKILATIVRLLETTFIRVGNAEYARTNHSFGLTTLRNRHVSIGPAVVTFNFHGKSGVEHTIDLHDRRLARIIRQCRDLPGYELFQYVDPEGHRHSIDAADVNEYLHRITGQHFTAKDFRTWAGTVLTCGLLRELEPFDSLAQAKKNLVSAIKSVAESLGNTPTVCRKCYIHPAVLDHYLAGSLLRAIDAKTEAAHPSHTLRKEELALLELLARKAA